MYEISFDSTSGAWSFAGNTDSILKLRLTILDPKTNVVLWVATEHMDGAALKSTWRKNYDKALSDLINDAKVLSTPFTPPASGAKP